MDYLRICSLESRIAIIGESIKNYVDTMDDYDISPEFLRTLVETLVNDAMELCESKKENSNGNL